MVGDDVADSNTLLDEDVHDGGGFRCASLLGSSFYFTYVGKGLVKKR